MGLDVRQRCFGVLKLREDTRFIGLQRVAQPAERFTDAVGVFQHGQFFFDLRLFARPQIGGREFFGLEAEPFFVAAAFFGCFAQGGQAARKFRKLLVLGPILRQQFAVAGYGVERRDAEIFRRKDQIPVLRMDVDQACAQFAQRGQLYRYVVDERAAFARRGDYAREGGLRGVVEVVFFEEIFEPAPLKVERSFHHAVARRVLDGRNVAPCAQQQPERPQEDRFSGSRLARNDVQMRVGLQRQRVDQCVVFNRETT